MLLIALAAAVVFLFAFHAKIGAYGSGLGVKATSSTAAKMWLNGEKAKIRSQASLHSRTGNGAVGIKVNIPIFNGFLYPARSREAGLRAQADEEQLRDLKDRIANDVRASWLNAITAFNRIGVTQQFVDQTNLAVDLSQTRYNLGLSSIVELSQAQLQQTEAAIQFAAAKYQYRIAESVLRFQIASSSPSVP